MNFIPLFCLLATFSIHFHPSLYGSSDLTHPLPDNSYDHANHLIKHNNPNQILLFFTQLDNRVSPKTVEMLFDFLKEKVKMLQLTDATIRDRIYDVHPTTKPYLIELLSNALLAHNSIKNIEPQNISTSPLSDDSDAEEESLFF